MILIFPVGQNQLYSLILLTMDKYLKQAIEEYERNIEKNDIFYMDASVLMDIEEYYEKENRKYDAERLMRFAEKLHPQNEEVLIVKAYRLKNEGKWSEALSLINRIENRDNRDLQAFLAEWETACGQPDKAETRLLGNMPAVLGSEDYDSFIDLAEILLDYGYTHRALHILQQIPDNYTFRRKADELMSEAYYQVQDYDKSLEYVTRVVDSDPYDAISWGQLADLQQKVGQYENCIASCDYSLAINPDYQPAMNLKLFATFRLNRIEEGFNLYKKFIISAPDDYSIRMYAAEQMLSSGQYQDALNIFHDALRLCPVDNPDHSRIVYDTSFTLSYLGKTGEAEELMLTLCLLDNPIKDIYFQLIGIYQETVQHNASLSVISKILDLPHSGKDSLQLAQILTNNITLSTSLEVWKKLAKDEINDYEFAAIYVYEAIAFYVFHQKTEFLHAFHKAAALCPSVLCEKFQVIFHTTDVNELLSLADETASQW